MSAVIGVRRRLLPWYLLPEAGSLAVTWPFLEQRKEGTLMAPAKDTLQGFHSLAERVNVLRTGDLGQFHT